MLAVLCQRCGRFMTTRRKAFYSQLFSGSSVAVSYRRALDSLRDTDDRQKISNDMTTKQRDIALDHDESTSSSPAKVKHPHIWGAFKCCGWTWWMPQDIHRLRHVVSKLAHSRKVTEIPAIAQGRTPPAANDRHRRSWRRVSAPHVCI